MRRIPEMAIVVAALAGLGAAPSALAQGADDQDPATTAALAEIRTATEKYRDVKVALADGYLRDPGNLCVEAPVEGLPPDLGGMGIHYFRPDLLGITAEAPRVAGTGIHTDFLQPSILLYVPTETGELKLVAVENLVFEEAWKAAGNDGPPEFRGHPYIHRIDDPATADVDEAHLFVPHYELHAWVYETNPTGTFSQYNPAVRCNYHDGPKTMAEMMSALSAASPPAGAHP